MMNFLRKFPVLFDLNFLKRPTGPSCQLPLLRVAGRRVSPVSWDSWSAVCVLGGWVRVTVLSRLDCLYYCASGVTSPSPGLT